jgi:molybdopterin converting factor small subunit
MHTGGGLEQQLGRPSGMADAADTFTTIERHRRARRLAPGPEETSLPMSVTVRVPTTLRTLTGGKSEVAVDGATVGEVLTSLEAAHPGFAERILDADGGLRRFVNVFVADDDVRFLEALATPVPDGETVSIIPAVAGG